MGGWTGQRPIPQESIPQESIPQERAHSGSEDIGENSCGIAVSAVPGQAEELADQNGRLKNSGSSHPYETTLRDLLYPY
jgi:hypothetical protein